MTLPAFTAAGIAPGWLAAARRMRLLPTEVDPFFMGQLGITSPHSNHVHGIDGHEHHLHETLRWPRHSPWAWGCRTEGNTITCWSSRNRIGSPKRHRRPPGAGVLAGSSPAQPFLQWQKRRHGLPACRGFSCCTTAESVPASCAGMQIATGRANPPMWVQDDTAQLESVIRRIAVAALDHRLTGCRPLEATVVLWSSKGNRRQRRQVCVKID
jgi:hypothetical protein